VKINSFGDYVAIVFPYAISITIAIAFVVLVFAGIEYATAAGSQTRLESAKGRMRAAIGGIIIAALAILILNTINPRLTDIDIGVPKTGSGGGVDTNEGGGGSTDNNESGPSSLLLAPILRFNERCSLDSDCMSGSCVLQETARGLRHKCSN